MAIFDVEPRISGDVYFGHNSRDSVILAGRIAEKGVGGDVYFDGSDNFVVLEVGKRGSGKSYGMGALLEGFTPPQPQNKSIAINDIGDRFPLINRAADFQRAQLRRRFDIVFPKPQNDPTLAPESSTDSTIPHYVALNLFYPKILVVFDFCFLLRPFVAMPKMAITKDRNPVFFKCKIWMAKDIRLH